MDVGMDPVKEFPGMFIEFRDDMSPIAVGMEEVKPQPASCITRNRFRFTMVEGMEEDRGTPVMYNPCKRDILPMEEGRLPVIEV